MEYILLFDATPIILTVVFMLIMIVGMIFGFYENVTIWMQEHFSGLAITVFLVFLIVFMIAEIWILCHESKKLFNGVLAVTHAVLDAGILFAYFYEILFEISSSYESSLWELFEFMIGLVVFLLLSVIPIVIIFGIFMLNALVLGCTDNLVIRLLFTVFIWAIKIALIWLIIWIYSRSPADQEGLAYIKEHYSNSIYLFESWKTSLYNK